MIEINDGNIGWWVITLIFAVLIAFQIAEMLWPQQVQFIKDKVQLPTPQRPKDLDEYPHALVPVTVFAQTASPFASDDSQRGIRYQIIGKESWFGGMIAVNPAPDGGWTQRYTETVPLFGQWYLQFDNGQIFRLDPTQPLVVNLN